MPTAKKKKKVVIAEYDGPDETLKMVEQVRAARVDIALQEVVTFIIERAGTNDFYLGYSLLEAMQDRIDTIGSLDEAEDLYKQETSDGASRLLRRTRSGAPTKQAELLALKEKGLKAIQAARNIVQVVEDTDVVANEEPKAIDDEGNFYITS